MDLATSVEKLERKAFWYKYLEFQLLYVVDHANNATQGLQCGLCIENRLLGSQTRAREIVLRWRTSARCGKRIAA